jgi:FkbM family methyltransferase
MFPASSERMLVQDFFANGRGFFVEVGANEPRAGSQTFHLEQLGWDGILIEPQPDLAVALRQSRKAKVYAVACSAPENSGRSMSLTLAGIYSTLNVRPSNAKAQTEGAIDVPVRTLDEILNQAQAPPPIDFLSIDVEGHEISVLRGFDFQRWKPRLILIEDIVLDRRLHSFIKAHGYVWMRRTGINSWYVPGTAAIKLSGYERLQLIRKYYLGVPLRRFRQLSRHVRRKLGLIREA